MGPTVPEYSATGGVWGGGWSVSHDPLPNISPEAARMLAWLKGLVTFGSRSHQGRFFGLLAPIPSHHENLFFLLLDLFLLHFVFLSFLAVLSQVKPQTGQGPSGSPAVTRGSSKGASFQILRMSHSLGPWCHSRAQASVMLRESLCCWYSHTWCPSGSWWVLIGV